MSKIATDIEHCTINDIGIEITGEDAQPLIDSINDYLYIFAKPIQRYNKNTHFHGFLEGKHVCLQCGSPLGGMLGSFTWGLCWGEGYCSKCSWPCRAYHVPKDDEGKIFDRPLDRILQYHPNNVTTKGKK